MIFNSTARSRDDANTERFDAIFAGISADHTRRGLGFAKRRKCFPISTTVCP